MRELFAMIEASREEYDTYIELSMVEIYNELIRDLLSDDFPATQKGGLKLLENEKERVTLANVTLKRPQSVEEVMELVVLGNQRRSTSFTESNSESSRSHAVLQINVGRNGKNGQTHQVDLDKELVRQCSSSATLSIIDLAGSERAAATKNLGSRMKEGANINKSLLALSNCISALCAASTRGTKPHIPYRNSKLTRMLKFSLGGNCRTVMIVCVSPSSKDIEDTHNTLVWADRAKHVKTQISRNTSGHNVSVRQYLVTIDTQSRRINLLEATLAKLNDPSRDAGKSTSTWQNSKIEASRAEAAKLLESARADLMAALPVINNGAKQRALWDTAEMRITALKRGLEEIEASKTGRTEEEIGKEKRFINTIISQLDSAFGLNSNVKAAVQDETVASKKLGSIFKSSEERTFGDVMEKHELAAYKLGIAGQRFELDRNVLTAREVGYRESAQSQAEAFAQVAIIVHRFISTVQDGTDLLSGAAQTISGAEEITSSVESLQSACKSTFSDLAAIFGHTSISSARPLSALPHVAESGPSGMPQLGFMSPGRLVTSTSAASALGPPARAGDFGVKAPAPAFHVNPAARRLLAGAPPSSPARAARVASPLKSALRRGLPHRFGHVKGRTPKKTARWKDEAGKGKLDDRSIALEALTFSSSSSVSPAEAGDSASDEWVEEDSESSPAGRPKPVPISLPKGLASGLPRPKSSPTNTSGNLFGPSITASTSAIPEWKKSRILAGKSTSRLSPLGEEVESSPERSGPSRSSANNSVLSLGAPSRLNRGPLAERQDNPAVSASSSVGTASFFANLARPTLASRSKLADTSIASGSSVNKLGPPSRRASSIGPLKTGRRTSTAGPYASAAAQKRSRGSLAPGSNGLVDVSLSLAGIEEIPSSSAGPSSNTSLSTSMSSTPALAGGPKRSNLSPLNEASPPAGRRSSFMPPPSAPAASASRFGTAPRASLSMAALPRGGMGLASRSSISNFRAVPPPAANPSNTSGSPAVAGGDTSVRGRWR